LKGLHDLAADPYRCGDYGAKDSTGRPVEIMLTGRFFITFWLDGSVKALRVINIERGLNR